MLRGYRLALYAGLGWIALVAASDGDPAAQRKQLDAQQSIANSLADIAAISNEQAERSKASKETEPCEPGDDRRYSDLCAQWKAADAATLAAWLSGASFVAVLIALWLAFRSNSIASDTAKQQLRAYVHANEIEWQERGYDGEQFVDFKIRFFNSGQTPAIDLQFAILGYLTEKDADPPEVNMDFRPDSQKHPLGPGTGILSNSHSSNTDDLNAVWRGEHRFFIAGIVRYRDAFSKKTRETRCHYEIRLGKEAGKFSYVWWHVVGAHNSAT